ncbi:HlyB/MsbA family ABC transporter [Lactarius akahatsu]|uniref:HlyB/MsbA family ABC transporter n=1 Tax=Lactarius akahatsu TaxID=416441 RepID=A0AAD4LIX5_9AGAM|nr:HlyB/MsbA family ABC transporter [Lactarius akahatsu]
MEKDSSMANDRKDSETGSELDPLNKTVFKHVNLGVWDLYVMRTRLSRYLPTSWNIEEYVRIWKDVPYLVRTLRDMDTVARLADSFRRKSERRGIFGKLLKAAMTCMFHQYDLSLLKVPARIRFCLKDTGGRALCTAVEHALGYASGKVATALGARARQFYSGRVFHSMARLDVPTWDDPSVSSQIKTLQPRIPDTESVALTAIMTLVETGSAFLRMFSEGAVLFRVLREQGDGSLLIPVSLASEAMSYFAIRSGFILSLGNTWAAITRNNDYVKMEGLNRVVKDTKHRKELVAGGLAEFLTAEYRSLADRLGGRANDFWTAYFSYVRTPTLEPISLLRVPLKELPQIIFTFQAVKKPMSIPVSLASLHLLQQSSDTFMMSIDVIFETMGSISDRLSSLRKLYEAENIPNKVVDGTIPFPENAQSISDGISLEFRNVSFRYPGSEQYALRCVSFKVLPGQLCVIVGSNGSGKSTILKLSARIFDPTDGSMLINGHDIKTLKLADLRRAMAILFQDYTLFPLSIRDNIGLGNPRLAGDDAAIEEAARLGRASELISRLPDGFDTYLERPVRDQYMGLPEGMRKLFGRKVVDGFPWFTSDTSDHERSGGQRQRLAVARTFMRSSTMEQEVGLLMFDEPSASLDPAAEHITIDLFSRIRKLRGNKTMILSTHRSGTLTRHADIILYMNDSAIVETGTHEELLKHEDSDYGRLWRMQAEAFL